MKWSLTFVFFFFVFQDRDRDGVPAVFNEHTNV